MICQLNKDARRRLGSATSGLRGKEKCVWGGASKHIHDHAQPWMDIQSTRARGGKEKSTVTIVIEWRVVARGQLFVEYR